MAQNRKEDEVILKIELDSFSDQLALEMGLKFIDLAKSRNQHFAIEILQVKSDHFSLC